MKEFDYLKNYDIQKKINKFAKKYKNKRIIVYGARKLSGITGNGQRILSILMKTWQYLKKIILNINNLLKSFRIVFLIHQIVGWILICKQSEKEAYNGFFKLS